MSNKIDPENWISQSEAADLRGVTRQAISQLVQKSRFRTLEIGGKVLVHREDVLSYEPDKGGRPPHSASEDNSTDQSVGRA